MRLRPALCSVGGIKGLLMPRNQVSDVSDGRQIFFVGILVFLGNISYSLILYKTIISQIVSQGNNYLITVILLFMLP